MTKEKRRPGTRTEGASSARRGAGNGRSPGAPAPPGEEARLSAQYAVTRLLADAPSITEAMPEVLEAICEALDWSVGVIWIVDAPAGVLRCLEYYERGEPIAADFEEICRGLTFSRGEPLPGTVWDTGQALWNTNVTSVASFSRAFAAERDELSSGFAFPILVAGEVIGVMEFFSREQRAQDGSMLQAMAALGSQVGQYLSRTQARDELERTVLELELARQRVRNLVANVPGVVWEVYVQPDPGRQRVNFISEYVEHMTGYSASEWKDIRNFWLELVHPDDKERAAAEAAAIFESNGTGTSEYRWVAKDGRVVWVESQSTVIMDERGVPIGMRGVIMDITERRNSEAKVRETEERFSKAFHASPAGLSIVSAHERRFIDVNESFLLTLGYERDEVIGKLVSDINLWPSMEERERFATALAASSGHARNVEVQIRTRSGELRTVLGSAELVSLSNEDCVLSLFYDITERKWAERRQALLAEAGAALASSLEYEKTLEAVARLSVREFAEVCSVDRVDGDTVQRLALAHRDPAREAALKERPPVFKPPRANHPLLRVAHDRQGELHADLGEDSIRPIARDERHLEALRALGLRSSIIVPLVTGGTSLGAMTFARSEESPVFTQDDLELAAELARRAGLAIDNSIRYDAEREARAQAQALAGRQEFLSEASAILSSSLDYETTLASVAAICVPYLGDWCAIDVLDANGKIQRLAVVHRDPAKVEFAKQLQERYPPDLERDGGLKDVIAGKSAFFPEITDELLEQTAQDEDHLRIAREMGLRSAIAVPLMSGGHTFGILTLVTAESSRMYTEDDLRLSEELGRRAGLAVENARLFRESQEVQEQLRKANEAKDEFLGLVSHELRTPITTIYGGARLLRARGDNLDVESRSGVLGDIEHESERLHRIVEDLLVLARIELGQEVVTEPVLVQREIDKIVQGFAKRRPTRTIDTYVLNEVPTVRASNSYLEQILRNLLNNADKYSPQDSTIEIRAERRGDEAVVAVLDRGPGIPDEERELIFERFYRSSGTAKQAGGAGIGLTVCKRLVEAQGGTIWAEPREGGGLAIAFSLPIYTDTYEV